MTRVCTACDEPATCTIAYRRDGITMPETLFCDLHDRTLHKALSPLTNPDIDHWIYQRLSPMSAIAKRWAA